MSIVIIGYYAVAYHLLRPLSVNFQEFTSFFAAIYQSLDLSYYIPFRNRATGQFYFRDFLFLFSPFNIDFLLSYLVYQLMNLQSVLTLEAWNFIRIVSVFALFVSGLRLVLKKYGFRGEIWLVLLLVLGPFFVLFCPAGVYGFALAPWLLNFYKLEQTTKPKAKYLFASLMAVSCFQFFNVYTMAAWAMIGVVVVRRKSTHFHRLGIYGGLGILIFLPHLLLAIYAFRDGIRGDEKQQAIFELTPQSNKTVKVSESILLEIPLMRFRLEGYSPTKPYYIFSYFLKAPFESTGDPMISDAYRINWADDSAKRLSATWGDAWNRDNLFQVGYGSPGKLSINIKTEEFSKYSKKIIQVRFAPVGREFSVIDQGSDHIDVAVAKSREPRTLTIYDSKLHHWLISVDHGEVSDVKAIRPSIDLPRDRDLNVKLKFHLPRFWLVLVLSYLLQTFLLTRIVGRKLSDD